MEQDTKNDTDVQKPSSGKFTFRFLIPTGVAGAIIGKGGERVKALNKKYNNAFFSLPDKNQPERVFIISIDLNLFLDCFTEILDNFTALQDDEMKTKTGALEFRMLIHHGLVSAFIGQKGARIKEFREKFKAYIRVFSEKMPLSSEQVLAIAAQKSEMPKIIYDIAEFLKEQPQRGGIIEQYDAANYNPQMAYNCGSYLIKDSSYPTQQNPYGRSASASYQSYGHVRPLMPQSHHPNLKKPRIAVDPIEEGKKAFEKKLRDQGLRPEPSAYPSAQPQFYQSRYGAPVYPAYVDPYAGHQYQDPYQRPRPARNPRAYEHEEEIESPPFEAIDPHLHSRSRNPRAHPVAPIEHSIEDDDNETSAQITVANELVPIVLGRRNESINQLREMFGVQIDVEPSGKSRLVTISGGFEQVDGAYAQIKESIFAATEGAAQKPSRRHY